MSSQRERGQTRMKRMAVGLVGLVCLLLGVGLILPALAKVRDFGEMPRDIVPPYTAGIVLAVGGLVVTGFAVMGARKAQR